MIFSCLIKLGQTLPDLPVFTNEAKRIIAAPTTRVKLILLYAIIVPFLSVVDFVLKGKVPVVCHSFLSTWKEVY